MFETPQKMSEPWVYSRIAATAAKRLDLSPPHMHLDSTRCHVDGRYNRDEPPSEQVVPITKGYSRDHRPDLTQVMLEWIVEPQAGIPVLMKPLRGTSSDPQEFGQVIQAHSNQWHITYGTTDLVAEGAL